MSPQEIATALVAALKRRGVIAIPGPSIQYGQKVEILSPAGLREGFVVVYTGKKGPRWTSNELPLATSEQLSLIKEAWEEAVRRPDQIDRSAEGVPVPTKCAESVDDLNDSALVDYARHLANLASRASIYASRTEIDWSELDNALRTLAKRVGYQIPELLGGGESLSAKRSAWADFADRLVESILERQTR